MPSEIKLHPACDWPYDPKRVEQYAERLRKGDSPPAVACVGDLIVDGRHRAEAWLQVAGNVNDLPSFQLRKDQDPREYVFRQHMTMASRLSIRDLYAQVTRHMAATGQTYEQCADLINQRYRKMLDNAHAAITTPPKPSKPRAPKAPPPLDPLEAHRATVKARKLAGDNKHLLAELEKALALNTAFQAAANAPQGKPLLPFPRRAHKRNMTAIVLASDWHVEETVTLAGAMQRNEYTLEIAAVRVKRFFQAVLWNIKHQRASGEINLEQLVLWLGGDLFSGYIHAELLEGNSLSPLQAIEWLVPRLFEGIQAIQAEIPVSVQCSFGNHGRTTDKTRISTGWANNMESAIYYQLARLLPDVPFTIPQAAHHVSSVYDFKIHWHHGDQVRFQGGTGGLSIPLNKSIAKWEKGFEADLHCIGHYHQLLDLGDAIVNGSLIGYSPYSVQFGYEPPQQAMFYMDEKRGKTMMTPLWVAE